MAAGQPRPRVKRQLLPNRPGPLVKRQLDLAGPRIQRLLPGGAGSGWPGPRVQGLLAGWAERVWPQGGLTDCIGGEQIIYK